MSEPGATAKRDWWTPIGVFLAAAFFAWLHHDRGLSLVEEGQILAEAESILNGRVLYRDLDGIVTPGVWYLTAVLFAVVGADLNATRLLMVVVFGCTAVAVFLLCQSASSRRAGFVAVGLLFVQKILVYPLATIVFYTEFAVLFALLAALALQRWRSEGSGVALGVAAGLCFALSVLFKQNVGGIAWILGLAWTFFFFRRGVGLLVGVPAAVGVVVLGAFAFAGALTETLTALVWMPISGFRENYAVSYFGAFSLTGGGLYDFFYLPGAIAVGLAGPAATAAKPLARLVSVGVYLATPVLLALGLRRVFREGVLAPERALLWAVALGIFSVAFPRADYPHLAQALVGAIPLAVYELSPARGGRVARGIGIAFAGLAGLLAGILFAALPTAQNFEHPRARLRVPAATKQAVCMQLRWIEAVVPRGEKLAVLPMSPIFYFLSGRESPLFETYVLPHNVGHDGGRSLAAGLDRAGVDYVLFSGGAVPGLPTIDRYAPALWEQLRSDYAVVRRPAGDGPGATLLRRRGVQAPRASGDRADHAKGGALSCAGDEFEHGT